MDRLQLSFKREFHADKVLKKQLDKHYRNISMEIEAFLSRKVMSNYRELYKIIDEENNDIKELKLSIKEKLQISLEDFLTHHIHMTINRQYAANQRKHELIIYDHLHRHYKKKQFERVL